MRGLVMRDDLGPRVEALGAEVGLCELIPVEPAGARCDVLDPDFVPLYLTVEIAVEAPDADVAVLMSGSAARAIAASGARIPVVAIGPQTAAEARTAGLEVAAEAATHDVDGLVEALRSV